LTRGHAPGRVCRVLGARANDGEGRNGGTITSSTTSLSTSRVRSPTGRYLSFLATSPIIARNPVLTTPRARRVGAIRLPSDRLAMGAAFPTFSALVLLPLPIAVQIEYRAVPSLPRRNGRRPVDVHMGESSAGGPDHHVVSQNLVFWHRESFTTSRGARSRRTEFSLNRPSYHSEPALMTR
jgi:hypothetical protein